MSDHWVSLVYESGLFMGSVIGPNLISNYIHFSLNWLVPPIAANIGFWLGLEISLAMSYGD